MFNIFVLLYAILTIRRIFAFYFFIIDRNFKISFYYTILLS